MLQPVIESSGLMDMITSDFIAMVDDFVSTNQTLQEKTSKDSEETDTDKTDKKDNTEEYSVSDSGLSKLQKQAKEQKQNLVDFLNGKREEEYLKTALLYLHPALRESALGVDKYSWTKSVYNVDYSSLPQSEATLSKDQIDREYKEWKEKANDLEKFRKVGVPAFDQMEKEFSGSIEEYANTAYGDVRKITIDRVLSQLNFDLNDAASEQEWREALKHISSDLHEAGLKGVSLEDQLQIGEKTKEKLVSSISGVNRSLFDRVIKFINTTSGD